MDVPDSKHIVAVCGSQRDGSHTRVALTGALEASERTGATTDLLDLTELELPAFDPAAPDAGDAVALRERLQAADGVILGSPMYHGSYSSVLKTALDYCGFEEFEDTTVGLLVVAGGGFPTPALEHLRTVARTLDAWVVPHQVAVPNADSAVSNGRVTDESLADRIETLGTTVAEYAGVESYPDQPAACAAPTAD